jgi:hypothetical protein
VRRWLLRVLARARPEALLLERSRWLKVLVNIAAVFDIIPRCLSGRVAWIGQRERRVIVSASVDRGRDGCSFKGGDIRLVVFDYYRAVCI